MDRVGIFYATSSGYARHAAGMMGRFWGDGAEVFNVACTPASAILPFSTLIIGTSTWGVGSMHYHMARFVDELASLDLSGKRVALFGLGDQVIYHETYCNGMGYVHRALEAMGVETVGGVGTEGYAFSHSMAVKAGRFVGLALDYENQKHLSEPRIARWIAGLRGGR